MLVALNMSYNNALLSLKPNEQLLDKVLLNFHMKKNVWPLWNILLPNI